MSKYVLGAGGEPYVAVRLQNVGDLVQQQGGATGKLAYSIAPKTITATAYDALRKKLIEGFAQQGVSADVTVQTTPGGGPPQTDLLRGIVIGAVGVGVGWAAWKYVLRDMIKRRR